MNKELITYIQNLTKNDTKTLSQKGLKVAEEAGELAGKLLPLDNAAGTIHRFVDKNHALEEVADTFLAAISVAFNLGFTYEEFEEMVHAKALYWNELQTREGKIDPNKIPFEIHVTVKPKEHLSFPADHFSYVCEEIGVKPVLLHLQNTDGTELMDDVMTSSAHVGSNFSAYDEMERIAHALEMRGYEVLRKKIETVPWHPMAPQDIEDGLDMPKNCYFETHIGCIIKNEEDAELVSLIAKQERAHLSKNIFKKYEDGSYKQMVTLRFYEGDYTGFKYFAQQLYDRLLLIGVVSDRLQIEFSIYDTKESHDNSWLKNEN